jgi:TatD DNase family protein
MTLIDAHCHLANLAELMPLEPLLKEASQRGIGYYLSSVLRKSEAEWHDENPNPRIIYSAGIHPNFDECDLDLDFLTALCEQKKLWAIGEIGLDRNNADIAWQKDVLIKQLELAQHYNLPVVLHIVGMQNEAYSILKNYPLRYLVHGYAGSVEGFHELARLKSLYTISSRILKPDKGKLLQAMLESGNYLFETDITQYYVKPGESNPLLRLLDVLSACSELGGISRNELIETQYRNANSYADYGFFQN